MTAVHALAASAEPFAPMLATVARDLLPDQALADRPAKGRLPMTPVEGLPLPAEDPSFRSDVGHSPTLNPLPFLNR